MKEVRFMEANIQNYINFAIIAIVSGLLNYFISSMLAKKKLWLAFLIPIATLVIGGLLVLAILADASSDGWEVIIVILLGFFTGIVFVSTLITSIIVYVKQKQRKV